MHSPQQFVEFELEKAHSTGRCLSGPTIFLGQPAKCRCDDALPARGQGNGGSSPLYNERLGVPIIFLCRAEQPSDADTGAINSRYFDRSTNLHHRSKRPNSALWRAIPSHFRQYRRQLVPAVKRKQGVTIRRRRLCHPPTRS